MFFLPGLDAVDALKQAIEMDPEFKRAEQARQLIAELMAAP